MTTTRLSRHINAPPAAVYRALIDAEAVRHWMVPDGMTSEIPQFEPREGGAFRISLTYDSPDGAGKTGGRTDTHHGRFVKLVPERMVVQTTVFETSDPALQGEMLITFTLRAEAAGRALTQSTSRCRRACGRKTTSSAGQSRSGSWRGSSRADASPGGRTGGTLTAGVVRPGPPRSSSDRPAPLPSQGSRRRASRPLRG